jgi:hypothetical protein
MSLDIVPFEVKTNKLTNPPMMTAIGIKAPFSMGIFGCSGSGKTVLCCSLMTNPNMFFRYFDYIYLFTPTGGCDDTFLHMGIPKNQIITSNFIEELQKIIDTQEKNVLEKGGVHRADKVCIIFEDLTTLKKFMNSKPFLQAFVQNRHLNISSIAICHKYKALNRTARLSCNHVMMFPCSIDERAQIRESYMTPGYTKKTFNKMLDEAFRPQYKTLPDGRPNPEGAMVRPFLHINNKSDIEKRFRKSFKYVLKS